MLENNSRAALNEDAGHQLPIPTSERPCLPLQKISICFYIFSNACIIINQGGINNLSSTSQLLVVVNITSIIWLSSSRVAYFKAALFQQHFFAKYIFCSSVAKRKHSSSL